MEERILNNRMKSKITSTLIVFALIFGLPFATAETKITSPSIAAGYNHCVGLNSYGRVHAAGNNDFGQCNTYGWKNVIAIAAGKYFSAALLSDGAVVTAGTGGLSDSCIDTSGWEGITKIVAGDSFLAGVTAEKTVVVTGKTEYNGYTIDTSQFADIEDIAAGESHLIGLKSDGTCVGTGYIPPANVSSWTGVSKIFAGANVSVALLEAGNLIYAGFPYTYESGPGEPSVWAGSFWTGIDEVIIVNTSSGKAATIGITTDGTYEVDDPEERAALDFTDIQDAKKTVARYNSDLSFTFSMVLHNDNSITVKGLDIKDETQRRWLYDIEDWRLDDEPFALEKPFPVFATGRYTAALVLPSGKLFIMGNQANMAGEFPAESVKDIVFIDSSIYSHDIYLAIDKDDNVISNITSYDFSDWNGVQKVSVTRLAGNYIAAALRWDKKVFCTHQDENILSLYGVRDIACGNYFFSALLSDKTVYTKTFGDYFFSTPDLDDIEKIIPGFSHLIGIKTDKTVVVKGSGADYSGHDVSGWSGIVDAAGGRDFTVGLKADGKCVSSSGSAAAGYGIDVSSWKNVRNVFAGYNYAIGYTNDGRFLYTGAANNKIADSIVNTLLTDSLFVNVTKNNSSTESRLILDFYEEGIDRDTARVYIAVYKENGDLADVKFESFGSPGETVQFTMDSLPENAARWKVLVWNRLKPIFAAEGAI
jgi:alpha-tubulin suppressor-like RCC1 family protein